MNKVTNVLNEIKPGLSNKEIADKLAISESSVVRGLAGEYSLLLELRLSAVAFLGSLLGPARIIKDIEPSDVLDGFTLIERTKLGGKFSINFYINFLGMGICKALKEIIEAHSLKVIEQPNGLVIING